MERREARFRARKDGIERPEGIGEEAVQRVLRVPPELAGMRLDRFLQGQLRATSRTRSQAIIDVCAFRPDGRPLKKNHRVQADERVILWRDPLDAEGAPETLTIVYQDEDILAVQKPPNVAVHPTARHHRATVSRILEDQLPDDRLTLIHRLDRETSGVLLLARTRAADRAVKIQFEERKNVDKRYLAIVWGHPPWDRQRCDLPLGPATDTIYRVKMGVVEGGLPSATSFEVLGRRWRGDRAYALVGCELHTGRQHQIR
ncbi:MAG: RluA family pseudouridine synthase, partial [Myxococcales bacterium]|nr:RluA family pseudouridine synthase [Myxococcales bacterium]